MFSRGTQQVPRENRSTAFSADGFCKPLPLSPFCQILWSKWLGLSSLLACWLLTLTQLSGWCRNSSLSAVPYIFAVIAKIMADELRFVKAGCLTKLIIPEYAAKGVISLSSRTGFFSGCKSHCRDEFLVTFDQNTLTFHRSSWENTCLTCFFRRHAL
jgi:hypothetical protein